jgi:dCMP deaminase
MNQHNWDKYFIDICEVVRQKSKDPSSKIGVVLVGTDNQIISTGFNGFPRGIDETDETRWERPIKYDFVTHGEENAIFNAARTGVSTKNSTLYLVGFGPPTVPCKDCCKAVIQAGIKRVVGFGYKLMQEHYRESCNFSLARLEEAGIEFVEFGI